MRAALYLLLAACTSGRAPARTVVVVSDPPPAVVEDAPCASDADCAPEPACRPPREVVAAACLQGKCVEKPVASPAQKN